VIAPPVLVVGVVHSRIGILAVAVLAALAGCASTPLVENDSGQNASGSGASAGTAGSGGTAGAAGSAGASGVFGATCLGAAGSPTAGKACGCDRDCDLEEVCFAEGFRGVGPPGGLCVHLCATDANCPESLVCVSLNPGGPERTCMQGCTQTSECRSGYICGALGPFLGQPPTGAPESFVCIPWCQSDSDCPATGACNPYTGICGTHGSSESDVAEPCERAVDCPSSTICFTDASYCSTWCSFSRQGCPDGSTCEQPFSDDRGDLGACMKSCAQDTDCRDDLTCVEPDTGRDNVCGPS
jgi:hypothetical protein